MTDYIQSDHDSSEGWSELWAAPSRFHEPHSAAEQLQPSGWEEEGWKALHASPCPLQSNSTFKPHPISLVFRVQKSILSLVILPKYKHILFQKHMIKCSSCYHLCERLTRYKSKKKSVSFQVPAVKSLQWSHWGIIWSHGILQDLPFCWNILLSVSYVSSHLLNPIPSLFLLPILLLWTLSCMIRTHTI